MQFQATQWANVEERRAVISVPMRLTFTRLLQFLQTRGPILWKSLSKQSCSMPAPQNAPSGSARGLLVWSMSKVMVVSVRQLSKAYLPSCALALDRCCPLFHDWPQLDLGSSTPQNTLDGVGHTPERPPLAAHGTLGKPLPPDL